MACGDDECPLEVVKYLVEECKVDVAVADNDGQLPSRCATNTTWLTCESTPVPASAVALSGLLQNGID